jgi:hypothetical protein
MVRLEPPQGADHMYCRLDAGAGAGQGLGGNNSQFASVDVVVHGASTDEGAIPVRYIRGCQGDMEEAARRWRETVAWRTENHIDDILYEPQPHFAIIKECYPHFLHRRDRTGHPIYYERLGYIDLKRLRSEGVTLDETLRYYVFLTEYIWTHIEPDNDHGALVTVLDVDNVGVWDLRGEALDFLKAASKIVQQHYVERSYRMFIVNAPSWFSLIWKVVAPMLNENTRRKINILGRDYKPMLEYIDTENLPTQYGGSDTSALGSSPEEDIFKKYIEDLNAGRIRNPRGSAAGAGAAAQTGIAAAATASTSLSSSFRRSSLTRAPSSTGGGERPGTGSGGGQGDGAGQGQGEGRWTKLGERFLAPLGAIIDHVRPSKLLGAQSPPPANLGGDNNFFYDRNRGEWVLQTEEPPADESEERLIRAIQAAHGYVPEQHPPHHEHTPSDSPMLPSSIQTEGSFSSALGSHSRAASYRSDSKDVQVRCSMLLLFIVLAWRSASVSTLLVLPLWLSDISGKNPRGVPSGPPEGIGLVLSLGAVLSLSFWLLSQVHCSGGRSFLSTFRAVVLALAINVACVFPLGAMRHQAGVTVLAVAAAGLALLQVGSSVEWAVGLCEALHKKESHVARYDLIPAQQLADLAGFVAGPLVFYLTVDNVPVGAYAYPLGPGFWFFLCGVFGAASLLALLFCGRGLLRRDRRSSSG